MHRGRFLHALVAAVAVATAGCSSYRYNAPPTARDTRAAPEPIEAGQPLVVVGPFENPNRASVKWRGIGPGMTEALARAIENRGPYEVMVEQKLARELERIYAAPADKREPRLDALRSSYPSAQFAIVGKVTDFSHSSDLPEELRRSALIGKKREAVVAIRFHVVDFDSGRIVVSDHVYGTAPAPKKPAKELYTGVEFDSYIFWNSPLGLASEKAIERAVDVILKAEPPVEEYLRIVRQTGTRRVELAQAGDPATAGDELYVCLADIGTGTLRPVYDPDTQQPLRVRIDATSEHGATAWLIGQKPVDVDLSGAILARALPPGRPIALHETSDDQPDP